MILNSLQRILVTKALDIKQSKSRIEAACSKIDSDSDSKIKLLIVDSIIYHYRAECAGRSKLPEKIQRLNKYMHLLLKTASCNAVAVVVTNHQTQSSSTADIFYLLLFENMTSSHDRCLIVYFVYAALQPVSHACDFFQYSLS